MQLVVDEIFKAPSRPGVAQNAPSVLPQARIRSDRGDRRVSICQLAHAVSVSVAHERRLCSNLGQLGAMEYC